MSVSSPTSGSMSCNSIVMSTCLCVLRAHCLRHISRPSYSSSSILQYQQQQKRVLKKARQETHKQIVKRVVIICTERSKNRKTKNGRDSCGFVALSVIDDAIDLVADDNTVAAGLLLLVDVLVLGAAFIRLIGERAAGTSAVKLDAVTLACDSVALACTA